MAQSLPVNFKANQEDQQIFSFLQAKLGLTRSQIIRSALRLYARKEQMPGLKSLPAPEALSA